MDLENLAVNNQSDCKPATGLRLSEFNLLSTEIYNLCGIQLPETKISLIEGRVRKRIKALGLKSFREYIDYWNSSKGKEQELIPLINAITTNKTDFFREKTHFDYLLETVLEEYEANPGANFTVWSAGCSSGEEPYTLAMLLKEYFENRKNHLFTIYASDISTDVLNIAIDGVYSADNVEVIPYNLKKKYLLKSKNHEQKEVRICPEIRRLVNFTRINFMEDDYKIPGSIDVVFCRNVLIYFDKYTQEKVLGKIAGKMKNGGYLFLGHSETILGMNLPFERVAATIYKKVKPE